MTPLGRGRGPSLREARPLGLVPRNARSGSTGPVVELALVQFAPRKGDVAANLRRIEEALATLRDDRDRFPDVVVFPEASLSGYFVEGATVEVARPARAVLDDLARSARRACGPKMASFDVVLGFYEEQDGQYYNSALYASLGRRPVLRHVHRKLFLPTYGIFDEERFVSRGTSIEAFDVPYGRAAILICEDACHSLAVTITALRGAQVLFVPSASPGRGMEEVEPANVRLWRDVLRVAAAEHGIFVAYAGLVGFEGGKGMSGASRVVGPFGDLRAEAPFEGPAILRTHIDLGDVRVARAALPALGDLEANLGQLSTMLAHEADAGMPAGRRAGSGRRR
jgi:predicted amidohydrolase